MRFQKGNQYVKKRWEKRIREDTSEQSLTAPKSMSKQSTMDFEEFHTWKEDFDALSETEKILYCQLNKLNPSWFKYKDERVIAEREQHYDEPLWPYEVDFQLFRQHYLSRLRVQWQMNAAVLLDKAIQEGYRIIFIRAPKRHGKSTFVIDKTQQRICFNKNDSHKYMTKASALAKEKITPIRENCEFNRKLKKDMRLAQGNLWSKDAFTIVRSAPREDPTLEACGLDSSYVGKNANWLVIDDPVDAKMSPDAMRAAHDKIFGEALNIMEPDGICIFILTRKAPEDIAACLEGKCPFCEHDHSQGVKILDFGKAILEGDFQHPGEDTYELVYDEQHTIKDVIIHGTYRTLAPELGWDIRELIKKYYTVGEAFFLREYQNDPSALEGRRLKTEWYNYFEEYNFFLDTIRGVTVDLALSDEPAADYTGIMGMGYSTVHNRFYVDRIYAMHKPLAEVYLQLLEYCQVFKPNIVLVEAIAAFHPLVKNWANTFPFNIELIDYKQTGKEARITAAWQPNLMNKRIWFKREHQDLITEAKNFPLSSKDHLLDAGEQFITWIQENSFSFQTEVI